MHSFFEFLYQQLFVKLQSVGVSKWYKRRCLTSYKTKSQRKCSVILIYINSIKNCSGLVSRTLETCNSRKSNNFATQTRVFKKFGSFYFWVIKWLEPQITVLFVQTILHVITMVYVYLNNRKMIFFVILRFDDCFFNFQEFRTSLFRRSSCC